MQDITHDLARVTGGGAALRTAGRVARKLGSKLVPGLNVASTAYDAYEGYRGYSRARAQGAGVGRATWEGVRSFAGFGSE